jgi:hypothetical protein
VAPHGEVPVGDGPLHDDKLLTRRALLWGAAAGLVALAAPSRLWAAARRSELLTAVGVDNGRVPFAGDGPLLTTVSPGGLRGRDRALVKFRLGRPATVRLDVVDRNTPGERSLVREQQGTTSDAALHTQEHRLAAGSHELVWQPPAGQTPGTYTLELHATDGDGTRRIFGGRGPKAPKLPQGPIVRVLGLDAAFTKRSYAAGDEAALLLAADVGSVAVQVYRSGPETVPTYANAELNGIAVQDPVVVDWRAHADRRATIAVPVGSWPTGVYYARIASGEALGFAPFVLRPAAPSARVAVILPTNTWSAYNFYDENGDGYGDSWYVWWRQQHLTATRPHLHRGVPYRYRSYDLQFIRWLAQTDKAVDYYADDDLESIATGDDLRTAYDLVVFSGHEEYVTTHAYDVVERYRDLGGNLLFLSANNFFRRVDPAENRLHLVDTWRDLGRPEAALCGVQYRGGDRGSHQQPFVVTAAGAASWAFADTGLAEGSSFGRYGIEIDGTTALSPPGTEVLAEIPNALGVPGLTAQMAYYETPAGARVFSAGALNFGGQIALWPEATKLLENVWQRLTVEA